MKCTLKLTLTALIIPIGIAIGIARVVMTSDCACTDKAGSIVNCLFELDAGKEQWVLDHPNKKSANLTWKDLTPYYCTDFWKRPVADETYHINKIGEPASVLVPKKTDWIPANSELRFSSLDSNRKVQIRSLAPGSPWTEP
jgi:hypothetical protein